MNHPPRVGPRFEVVYFFHILLTKDLIVIRITEKCNK